MKKVIAIGMILALVLSTTPVQQPVRGQQIAPACYEALLALGIGFVFVYGIYKVCTSPNFQDPNPPAEVPPEVWTNAPAPGAPFQVLPPLRLQYQLFGQAIIGQHKETGLTFRERTNWITDFSVTAQLDGTMVLSDANGVPLATNTPVVINSGGHEWRIFDFTGIPLATNLSNGRLFRLVGQQP